MLDDNSITTTLEDYCKFLEEMAVTMEPLDTSNNTFSNKDRKQAARLFRDKLSKLENFPTIKKYCLIGGNLFTPSFLLVQAGVLFYDVKTIRDKATAKSERFQK